MITRKHLVLTVLVTACMMLSLFQMLPASSQVGEYDPWADYDGNGTVDIFDVVAVGISFGLDGDPTRNVNIMNWPGTKQQTVYWYQSTGLGTQLYNGSGFSQIHLTWKVSSLSDPEYVTFRLSSTILNPDDSGGRIYVNYIQQFDVTAANASGTLSFPLPSEEFMFYLVFHSGTTAYVYMAFRLT